ncbi:reverse transcriptase domain-containing protein [Entomobacter blattae]|uniref:Reverse transcriptase n=1 Tax=Entomobacter blattae TaxID=2762277 RepID=A0A7H1NRG3_9PROT|nr:reverse transcriptase domain-containing protein [Entomobacter blattae]QNT78373.1 Reverse transcriptase [Entomobacter blattae]
MDAVDPSEQASLSAWFKGRTFRHFDRPIGPKALEELVRKLADPIQVSQHKFSPLIQFTQKTRHRRRSRPKEREICYPSHKDSAILGYYAYQLNEALTQYYKKEDLDKNIIAYRNLGKANNDFAAQARRFAEENKPAMIMTFDVKNFFGSLNHAKLKHRLQALLQAYGPAPLTPQGPTAPSTNPQTLSASPPLLPKDWYSVFRFTSQYHFVQLEDLKNTEPFVSRLSRRENFIGTIKELKEKGIPIYPNPGTRDPTKPDNKPLNSRERHGIPQGTPISAAFSNLYMMEFDKELKTYCTHLNALYLRYSDDILIICPHDPSASMEDITTTIIDNIRNTVLTLLAKEGLQCAEHKTDITQYGKTISESITQTPPYKSPFSPFKQAQYLGFILAEDGTTIRGSSIARQWRKLVPALKAFQRYSCNLKKKPPPKNGLPKNPSTKKLLKRFALIPIMVKIPSLKEEEPIKHKVRCYARNFPAYAWRSAKIFRDTGDTNEKISKQCRNFEKKFYAALHRAQRGENPFPSKKKRTHPSTALFTSHNPE